MRASLKLSHLTLLLIDIPTRDTRLQYFPRGSDNNNSSIEYARTSRQACYCDRCACLRDCRGVLHCIVGAGSCPAFHQLAGEEVIMVRTTGVGPKRGKMSGVGTPRPIMGVNLIVDLAGGISGVQRRRPKKLHSKTYSGLRNSFPFAEIYPSQLDSYLSSRY